MEEQALATFNHAAEEMRFLREYEWLITNYAMIAYSALVAAPLLVAKQSWLWRTWVSVLALVLVLLAAWQAERVLWFTDDERNVARARLHEAVHHLPLVCSIRQEHRFKPRSERPLWVGFGKPNLPDPPPCGTLARPGAAPDQHGEAGADDEASHEADIGPGLGLEAVVFIGALFASLIILSRIPFQRVVAWFSQSASGGSWPAS